MPEKNKTKLRLEIDKTIQPKQFEPIKIIVDVEETFYWKDEAEKKKKTQAYIDEVTVNFVKTFNQVLERIGEPNSCIGKVVTTDRALVGNSEDIDANKDLKELENWN